MRIEADLQWYQNPVDGRCLAQLLALGEPVTADVGTVRRRLHQLVDGRQAPPLDHVRKAVTVRVLGPDVHGDAREHLRQVARAVDVRVVAAGDSGDVLELVAVCAAEADRVYRRVPLGRGPGLGPPPAALAVGQQDGGMGPRVVARVGEVVVCPGDVVADVRTTAGVQAIDRQLTAPKSPDDP